MSSNKSIEFLDNLQVGMPCNVNIKLGNGVIISKTCLYAGKQNNKYTFFDGEGISSFFRYSKKFIEEKDVVVNDDFDDDRFSELIYLIHMQDEKPQFQETEEFE